MQKLSMIFLGIVLLGVSCAKDDSAATDNSTANRGIAISGSLAMSSSVSANNGLTSGQKLSGGEIFLKGHPETSTKSDADGNFSLTVDLTAEELALVNTGVKQFQALMWYTVAGASGSTALARFGTQKEFGSTGSKGDVVKVGSVSLTYTNALHIYVKDKTTKAAIDGCTVAVNGYGSKLLVVPMNNGQYDIDYLPISTIDILFSCSGYKNKTISYDVPPAKAVDDWATVPDVLMEAGQ